MEVRAGDYRLLPVVQNMSESYNDADNIINICNVGL
jgi:hypothetical protein